MILVYRFNPFYDSLTKLIYLIFIYFSFLICNIFNTIYSTQSIKYFEIGIYIACVYTWYLAIVSIQNIEPFLLPGMDSFPQHTLFSIGHYIRCGTFKEGNHMGLLLFIGFIIGITNRRYLLAFVCCITILPTVSTMALVCVFLYCSYLFIVFMVDHKKYRWLIAPIIGCILILGYRLKDNADVQLLITQKLLPSTIKTDYSKDWGAYSKADRFNHLKVSWQIFKENLMIFLIL
jgi:hypothetical protein